MTERVIQHAMHLGAPYEDGATTFANSARLPQISEDLRLKSATVSTRQCLRFASSNATTSNSRPPGKQLSTPCYALKHPATPCNTLQHTAKTSNSATLSTRQCLQFACSTATASTHCNTLQHTQPADPTTVITSVYCQQRVGSYVYMCT